jgi:hypothetical protein
MGETSVPNRLDLRTVLAAAGAAATLGAVIGGFVIVGGPGDARALRYDERTLTNIEIAARLARCAYSLDGETPASLDEARVAFEARQPEAEMLGCYFNPGDLDRVDEVTYARTGDAAIEVCSSFRRPSQTTDDAFSMFSFSMTGEFPELSEPRPEAGEACYDIELVSLADPFGDVYDEPVQDGFFDEPAPGEGDWGDDEPPAE